MKYIVIIFSLAYSIAVYAQEQDSITFSFVSGVESRTYASTKGSLISDRPSVYFKGTLAKRSWSALIIKSFDPFDTKSGGNYTLLEGAYTHKLMEKFYLWAIVDVVILEEDLVPVLPILPITEIGIQHRATPVVAWELRSAVIIPTKVSPDIYVVVRPRITFLIRKSWSATANMWLSNDDFTGGIEVLSPKLKLNKCWFQLSGVWNYRITWSQEQSGIFSAKATIGF